MLLRLEQDMGPVGDVRPALVNPAVVASVTQYVTGPSLIRTMITFTGGHELLVAGQCEDIGRQIQEALKPPIDLRTLPPTSELLARDICSGQAPELMDAIQGLIRGALRKHDREG